MGDAFPPLPVSGSHDERNATRSEWDRRPPRERRERPL